MTDARDTYVTEADIDRVAKELAEAVGIDADNARRVLEILHVGKLNENLAAMGRVLQDREATNALGMSHREVGGLQDTLKAENFTLANLRLAIKPSGQQGLTV